jgi:hypothetical protein
MKISLNQLINRAEHGGGRRVDRDRFLGIMSAEKLTR